MESEKVKEIKKALECNATDKHDNLSYIDENDKCQLMPFADILTLINDLERENERLKQSNKNILFVNEQVIKQNTELKDRIAELEKEIEENAFYSKGYAQGIKNTYEVVVPEKLKYFAEIFKQKCIDGGIFPAFVARKLEETLKEFIENV